MYVCWSNVRLICNHMIKAKRQRQRNALNLLCQNQIESSFRCTYLFHIAISKWTHRHRLDYLQGMNVCNRRRYPQYLLIHTNSSTKTFPFGCNSFHKAILKLNRKNVILCIFLLQSWQVHAFRDGAIHYDASASASIFYFSFALHKD